MAGGKHILGKPKSHRIFGTARVGERGQIVIPKEARQFYDIRPGDTVLVLGSGGASSTAVAVLQATTTALIPRGMNAAMQLAVNSRTSSVDRSP